MSIIKIDQAFLDKLIESNQQDRFLLIYPYLKNCIFVNLRNKFKNINYFDWNDFCAQVYYDMFVLCETDKWIKYHPSQVKRFLFVVSSNCMLRQLQIINNYKKNIFSIDSFEGFPSDIEEGISVFDVIESKGNEIEGQLIRLYQRLLGEKIINEEYKTVLKRYARVIAERIISKSNGYKTTFFISCKTDEIMSNVSSFS